jgi:opacity protein-like surface antigen
MKGMILSLSLLTMAVIQAGAQGFHLGIKAGANIMKVNGESFSDEFQYGYNVGAFSQINFTRNWGIQPELNWNQTNYRTGTEFSNVYPNFNNYQGKLNYLSIPLLLNYRPAPFLSFLVGPQFGILMNSDENLVENGKNAFKKGDFSMIAGAQLNIANFLVGARYQIGLSNINDIDNQDTWKNQGWQLYVGMRFF